VLAQYKLPLALRVPSGRITSILNGKRAISPDTALRLARFFGNSTQLWMKLQTRYDLTVVEGELGKRIDAEVEHMCEIMNAKISEPRSPDRGGKTTLHICDTSAVCATKDQETGRTVLRPPTQPLDEDIPRCLVQRH